MGSYYKNADVFLDRIDPGIWVEIGVERGEGSTRWFVDQSKNRATHFYAVDAMKEQTDNCKALLTQDGAMPENTTVVNTRGEYFLEQMQTTIGQDRISLAYLDNFDWDYWLGGEEEGFVSEVKQRYLKNLGIDMTNLHSQLTHLAQAINLHSMLAEHCLVICDDTWYEPDQGVFMGKCSAAIPFLMLTCKLDLLHNEGYRQNSGVILGRLRD